jgi:hypothetical protein
MTIVWGLKKIQNFYSVSLKNLYMTVLYILYLTNENKFNAIKKKKTR